MSGDIENIEERYYSIQLYGANPDSASSKAKISLNKIDEITKFKWYLGKDGYPYTFIKGGRAPLHRYIWWLNTGMCNNQKIGDNGKITKLYIDHINFE